VKDSSSGNDQHPATAGLNEFGCRCENVQFVDTQLHEVVIRSNHVCEEAKKWSKIVRSIRVPRPAKWVCCTEIGSLANASSFSRAVSSDYQISSRADSRIDITFRN
jgi:hypothetical protein